MITITFHSGIYTLTAHQRLPISPDVAWTFLSDPYNLGAITPDYMGFIITSETGGAMYPGQIITYSIGLLPGLRSNWVTEVTHVDRGRFFVDEQRFGPYAMWHHEHWLTPVQDGVCMYDRVSYKLPLGGFGRMLSPLIKRQLKQIFAYRHRTLASHFSPDRPHEGPPLSEPH